MRLILQILVDKCHKYTFGAFRTTDESEKSSCNFTVNKP